MPIRAGALVATMFLVIACPRCRRARVVEAGKKTTQCGSCGRTLEIKDLRAHHQGDQLDEARHAAGLLNARLAGREAEFFGVLVPPPAKPPRHDDAFSAAAAASRRASSESDRANAVARELASQMGEFREEDLAKAFHVAGLREPGKHLRRMLETLVLYEPKAGRYAAL